MQVARLAGMPAAVIRGARRRLAELEEHGFTVAPQRDLFAEPREDATLSVPRHQEVLARLMEINPDALSPKEALELLYQLRKQLED